MEMSDQIVTNEEHREQQQNLNESKNETNRDNNNNNQDLCYAHFVAKVQDLVQDIQDKRKQDDYYQSEFRAKLVEWAEESSARMCSNVQTMISSHSVVINNKFEGICNAMQRIKKLEEEYDELKTRIGMIYKEATNKTNL